MDNFFGNDYALYFVVTLIICLGFKIVWSLMRSVKL